MRSRAAGTAEPGQPHTVLVVEDEILVRVVLAEHLRGCGYRVLEAANAAAAIELLAAEPAVDVLLTDVQMPGELDGLGLARWARAHRPQVRIIVTSGHDRAAHKLGDLGDDEPYLRKPYDPTHLVGEIGRLLAGR